MCDGIGMGLGFTVALGMIGILPRADLGAGTIFGVTDSPSERNVRSQPGSLATVWHRVHSWFVAALAAIQNTSGDCRRATNGSVKRGEAQGRLQRRLHGMPDMLQTLKTEQEEKA